MPRERRFNFRHALMMGCAIALAQGAAATAAPAVAQASLHEYAIPAQPLADALRTFATQTGRDVLFAPAIVAGKTSAAVKGAMTELEALRALLAGTGLSFQTTSTNGYAVRLSADAAPAKQAQAAGSRAEPSSGQPSDTEAADARDVDTTSSDSKVEKVTVTGTRIRGAAPAGSPVIVIDRDEIDRSGAANVDQFMRTIPQNFSQVDGTTGLNNGNNQQAAANASLGAAANLRGLGLGATLTLVNGRRLAPAGSDGSFVDVSLIPLGAVERIELLTDGASAIYGADAVAGVVNFVLRKDFDGAQSAVRYGDTTRGGAEQFTASQLFGAAWTGGNALLSLEYDQQSPLDASERGFIPLQSGPTKIVPEAERHSAFFSGRQSLSGNFEVFADGLYSDRTFSQDAVSGPFLQHAEGAASQKAGVVGAGYDFWDDWRAEVVGQHAVAEQDQTITPAGFPSTRFGSKSTFTSLDFHTDGSIFSTGGGNARALIGASVRRETFDDLNPFSVGIGLKRRVLSAFGELFLPLVSSANAVPGIARLEVSAAARYDHYDNRDASAEDFSSVNPKVGVRWSPVDDLSLRGTYATSFRVAPLARISEGGNSAFQAVLAPGSNTLLLFGGNRDLQPEESESYTFGADWDPDAIPGLKLSGTYFNIDYRGKISGPPVIGSPFLVLTQVATLAPFLNFAPTPAEIAAIYASVPVTDITGAGPAGVQVIYDGRYQNIASLKTSGIDFSGHYGFDADADRIDLFLAGTYLIELDSKSASTTPTVGVLDTVFNPIDLRVRGGATWTGGGWSSTITVNYTDSYGNPTTVPASRIDAWTTADWQLSYRTQDRPDLFGDVVIALTVQNVTDEKPPFVALATSGFQYDATNASPLGRVVSLQITKVW